MPTKKEAGVAVAGGAAAAAAAAAAANQDEGTTDAKPTSYLKQKKGGLNTDSLFNTLSTPEGSMHPGTMVSARRAKADVDAGRSTDIAKTPRKKDQSRLGPSASNYMSGDDWDR